MQNKTTIEQQQQKVQISRGPVDGPNATGFPNLDELKRLRHAEELLKKMQMQAQESVLHKP